AAAKPADVAIRKPFFFMGTPSNERMYLPTMRRYHSNPIWRYFSIFFLSVPKKSQAEPSLTNCKRSSFCPRRRLGARPGRARVFHHIHMHGPKAEVSSGRLRGT